MGVYNIWHNELFSKFLQYFSPLDLITIVLAVSNNNLILIPHSTESGRWAMSSPRIPVPPSEAFCFRSISRKPMGDLFHIAHTHPLRGVVVPFEVYNL